MLKNWLSGSLDPITLTEHVTERIPAGFRPGLVRRRLLDVLLNVQIPFNRWLGLRIKEFSPLKVTIESPPSILRRNHVGTAHACAQALIGEYAAGLVVAQKFPIEKFRMIIGKLEIEYSKAGRGTLLGTAKAPNEWPELVDDAGWVPMKTEITDEKGNLVAVCSTNWQVKSWKKIEADKKVRSS